MYTYRLKIKWGFNKQTNVLDPMDHNLGVLTTPTAGAAAPNANHRAKV
jgi:hypothetical protein